MKQHIPTSDAPLPFTPKILSTGQEGEPVFLVKPMTQADYDRLGFELFRHNVSPITQDTFRAYMIDEIFNLYGDVEGEKHADLMDEFWQGEDIFNLQVEEWMLREKERLWDQSRGAPEREPEPAPRKSVSARRRAAANLFAERLKNESRRIRDLTIEMQTYAPRQAEGISRLVIEGWSGLSTPFRKENGIVPDDIFQQLKAEVGKEALAELQTFIMSMGNIDPVEAGNSDSPPANESGQTGSPEQSGELDSSDGSLTSAADPTASSSPGSPTLESGSVETTAQSLSSISDVTGESPNTAASPMAAD